MMMKAVSQYMSLFGLFLIINGYGVTGDEINSIKQYPHKYLVLKIKNQWQSSDELMQQRTQFKAELAALMKEKKENFEHLYEWQKELAQFALKIAAIEYELNHRQIFFQDS